MKRLACLLATLMVLLYAACGDNDQPTVDAALEASADIAVDIPVQDDAAEEAAVEEASVSSDAEGE